jgi:head-tail adaptor
VAVRAELWDLMARSDLRGVGTMSEQLRMQQNVPPVAAVVVTRIGTVATGTTTVPHQLLSTDNVTLAVDVAGYNGRRKVTVLSPTVFTFPISGDPATPARGTVTYLSDAQGGRRSFWADLVAIWAELIPLSASERLEREAIKSTVRYRFRVFERPDIRAAMRAKWTPSWGGEERALEVIGPPLPANNVRFMYLDMASGE